MTWNGKGIRFSGILFVADVGLSCLFLLEGLVKKFVFAYCRRPYDEASEMEESVQFISKIGSYALTVVAPLGPQRSVFPRFLPSPRHANAPHV